MPENEYDQRTLQKATLLGERHPNSLARWEVTQFSSLVSDWFYTSSGTRIWPIFHLSFVTGHLSFENQGDDKREMTMNE